MNDNLKWAYLENIVTLIVVLVGCYFISGWFALLLINLNSVKIKS